MGFVRTVCGDVDPGRLGATYVHEHVLCRAPPRLVAAEGDDLVLDDEERAGAELRLFTQAGGGAIVDLTCREYGRDARGLRRLAEATGVHLVAATGHITEGYWAGVLDIAGRSDAELADEMIRDLTEGLDGTGIRAGVIKAGTSHGRVTPDEHRVLRAAAVAQRETGAPIATHTGAGTMALAQVEILKTAGADLDHVIIGHVDRRLVWDDHAAVARSGAYLGYDCISKEQYAPDAARIEFLRRLVKGGHGDRVCFSGDLARRSYLTSYGGGPGFSYILWRFLPWLRREGFSGEQVRAFVVGNPARLLAWRG